MHSPLIMLSRLVTFYCFIVVLYRIVLYCIIQCIVHYTTVLWPVLKVKIDLTNAMQFITMHSFDATLQYLYHWINNRLIDVIHWYTNSIVMLLIDTDCRTAFNCNLIDWLNECGSYSKVSPSINWFVEWRYFTSIAFNCHSNCHSIDLVWFDLISWMMV